MPSDRKQEQIAVVQSSSVKPDDAVVSGGQIKCLMFGVGTIVFMNLALTVVALVLGLQIKSEVEAMQAELEPLMELANSLEGIMALGEDGGGIGGVGVGGLPTPP